VSHPPLPPLPSDHAFVAIKMVPRVYELSDCRSALRMRWRGLTPAEYHRDTFHKLVDYLQLLHACGIAHTDLHPDNLVMRGWQIVAIDYGSMVRLYAKHIYRGNTVCASDRVLLSLRANLRTFSVTPSDELHNLVRCAYMLLVPHSQRYNFEEALRRARGGNTFTAADWKLAEFWNEILKGRIWEPMLQHADECDYAALKRDFQDIYLG
jgi:serine/threonine protein kinase